MIIVGDFEAYRDQFSMFLTKDPLLGMLKATHDLQRKALSCGTSGGLKYDMDTTTFFVSLKLNYPQK